MLAEDVPFRDFHRWASTRVADEVMDQLVPDWRERERQRRNGVVMVPLESADATASGEVRRVVGPARSADRGKLAALRQLSMRDLRLVRFLYEQNLTPAQAGERVRLVPNAVYQAVHRLPRRLGA